LTVAVSGSSFAIIFATSSVLQMGAGFIGCIILEAIAARGVQLSVVDMGDRMVPRMMGEGAGGMIKRWVEKKGVTVYTSTRRGNRARRTACRSALQRQASSC
jgi:NADPH-dependent 2,4-dienoyl-CoA reductase/sulfur reductase-like enzyme